MIICFRSSGSWPGFILSLGFSDILVQVQSKVMFLFFFMNSRFLKVDISINSGLNQDSSSRSGSGSE